MLVNRRTFSTMLAGAAVMPRLAFAQAKNNCAFYSGVGGQLTHYEVDFGAATLAKRAAVTLPGGNVLVAYNFPSNVSVHKIKGDGSIGDEVKQSEGLEKGIYFHQIRATPADKTVLIVARGNNPEGAKPEDPGSLHVYDFKNGVLSHRRRIAPNGGYGFGGRHLDIHPSQPWVYLSVERQNQLIVYKLTPDGDLAPEPLFTKPTLADP